MNRLLSTLALALFALDCAAIELGVAGTFDVDTADIAITPGVPAGYVAGNGVFLMGHVLLADGGTEDVNTPMGWTELVSHEVQASGFNSARTTVFCKVPGESESSPSVTTANATSANNHGATIVWYEDALADCSMVVNTSGNAGANEANLAHAGLTIADADLLFALFGGKRGVDGSTATVDALGTDALSWNRIEKNGTAIGIDLLLVIDDVIPGDADNLSSGSWNISVGDSSGRGASVALALEPSAGAAPKVSLGHLAGPYNTAQTIYIKFSGVDALPLIGEVDGGTEVTLSCDGGTPATATNDFGVDTNTPGRYPLTLTAAETACKVLTIDVAASVAQALELETYGHASAQHPSVGLIQHAALDAAILNCEVNTAFTAASTTSAACILTDRHGGAVTAANDDLEQSEIIVLDGAEQYQRRNIIESAWDGANSELEITWDRPLGTTVADAVNLLIL